MKRKALWINVIVGVIWIGIGLRDAFAPHLFRFDGQVATTSTITLDFVLGILLLCAAVSLRSIKSTGAHLRH